MGGTRAFAALLACLLGAQVAFATLPELSELPSLTPFGLSEALAVSRDGRVVGGQANGVAVRWIDDALTTLAVPGLAGGVVLDASGDGSVLVGESLRSEFSSEAVLWRDGEASLLGRLPDSVNDRVVASGVSADGRVVVGQSGGVAFRWEAGEMQALPFFPNCGEPPYSEAADVSADGRVIVGVSTSGCRPILSDAFRLVDGELEALGHLDWIPGFTRPRGVSADGRVVVGESRSLRAAPYEAFRWKDGVMQPLGDLPGGLFLSVAHAASADGSVVVGTARTDTGLQAFLWDAAHGMRSLAAVVEGLGLSLQGRVQLRQAYDISDDGRVIVGFGAPLAGQTQGWKLVLPPACSDSIDNDGDGLVDHPEDPACSGPEALSEAFRTDVAIDILPGQEPNRVFLTPHALVPVALLGSASVDVFELDRASLRFGASGAQPVFDLRNPWVFFLSLTDVDADGARDLVAWFDVEDSGLAPEHAEACLEGGISGAPFRACAAVQVLPAVCDLGFEAALLLPLFAWHRARLRRRC